MNAGSFKLKSLNDFQKDNVLIKSQIMCFKKTSSTVIDTDWVSHVSKLWYCILSHPKPHSDLCASTEKDRIYLQESQGEEGLSPSESLCKESPEAVDLQCMVDLPCTIFKETVGGADF